MTPNAPLYAPYYGNTAPLFAATQRFSIDPVSSFAPPGSAVRESDYARLSTYGIASFLNETSPVNGVSYPAATRTPTQNITGTYWVRFFLIFCFERKRNKKKKKLTVFFQLLFFSLPPPPPHHPPPTNRATTARRIWAPRQPSTTRS